MNVSLINVMNIIQLQIIQFKIYEAQIVHSMYNVYSTLLSFHSLRI